MKKILITTGIFFPDIGGPASYARAIGTRLALTRDVTVLTYSPVWRDVSDKKLPFRVIRVWKKWPWFVRHLVYIWKVLLQARQADLLLALNAVNAGPAGVVACRLFKKKLVVRIVGDRAWEGAIEAGKTNLLINDFQKVRRTGWASFLHWLQVWTCRNAAAVIVPSEYLLSIVQGWGIRQEKIHVIYNGVDFKAATVSKEEARKHIGISGNLILSVGRLAPWKGFRMLIKMMPQLLQVNQFFRLIIVGSGPEAPVLQSMVKNLGLERKVYLVGKKSPDELAYYLAAADLFVLNTGYEGFSHQILEAFVAGVPVITTAVGGNREVIEQGENGFLVKYNDEFNLLEAIKTLWGMPELREKFVAAGKETVEHFSFERMEAETLRLLESV